VEPVNPGKDVESPAERAVRRHEEHGGKIRTLPKVPVGPGDLADWYTPGVAAPSRVVAADPTAVSRLTNRGNTVAVVTDGSRVLGLGDVGPEAALPVMEGKALLFGYLGGVDAVPVCLATTDPDEIVRTVEILAPTFGAVNLEDIASPRCFAVLDRLRATLPIPVWHDDQQGTALVVAAALTNALTLVGKRLSEVRVALVGTGAANVANLRLLSTMGLDPAHVVACDSTGILHPGRADLVGHPVKWDLCLETNPGRREGGVAETLAGADVCLAFSRPGPGVVTPAHVTGMASGAVVFACANPVPEIPPDEARAAGARIVATGRSDLPNQVNNSLAFPGLFRGVLDVGARSISDGMVRAAVDALAAYGRETGLADDRLLPSQDDVEAHVRVAVAAGSAAVAEGLARTPRSPAELAGLARKRIAATRDALAALVAAGCVIP